MWMRAASMLSSAGNASATTMQMLRPSTLSACTRLVKISLMLLTSSSFLHTRRFVWRRTCCTSGQPWISP
eukprot:8823878-Pyramimonas_sp.AAC.1